MSGLPGALDIARDIRDGKMSAREAAQQALARVASLDPKLNAFTLVTSERALTEAAAVDARRARGEKLPSLAGVPYAVKNLYDIAGVTTLAGSRIEASKPLAARDATAIASLAKAGAVLVGALNMDEYAYGFVTENAHYGTTRNPHDPSRICGGSSGGSAASVASGMVPLALGSDTNGSIRVPAALCGIFGLKPTYGRLSRAGAYPFSASLDHVGPFARSVADLAACYDALQGSDARDPVCREGPPEPASPDLARGVKDLRVAVAGGYFAPENAGLQEILARAAKALNASRQVEIPAAGHARAAAFLITAAEGGALHLPDLKTRAAEFDPAVRDRLIAGALIPAAWVIAAQRFRAWYREQVLALFRESDIILAPCSPGPAPGIGQESMELGGAMVNIRASLGIYTQPLSFIGLPVVAAPIAQAGKLPLGIQIIAAPWRESLALRAAYALEQEGIAAAPVPTL
ncbi:MAG TPA: AtzE family amidohydrolase [Stellaceae bacterium]|nr:AtzE family amidohydrolase [Stellaceae bacterium]